MVDLVHQLREDAKTASPESLRVMCGWGADEIERLRAVLRKAVEAIDTAESCIDASDQVDAFNFIQDVRKAAIAALAR